MTPQEKTISEANKYVIPAVKDYLAARCLLLNVIFVGLILAHEAIEKLMKALLILEEIKLQKSHNIKKLADTLLGKNPEKYKFLKNQEEFIKRLDQHYGWRYYDGDITRRSQEQSSQDLQPLDVLWIALHDTYISFLPAEFKFHTYFYTDLFDEDINKYTNWGEILKADNIAIKNKLNLWETEYKKTFNRNTK